MQDNLYYLQCALLLDSISDYCAGTKVIRRNLLYDRIITKKPGNLYSPVSLGLIPL